MGGRSHTGLEVKLREELRFELGDLMGVSGRGCGAMVGDMYEPSMTDCEDNGGGCRDGSVSPLWVIPEDSCED